MGILFHGVGIVGPPGQISAELEIHEQAEHESDGPDEELVGQWALNFNVVNPGILNFRTNIAAFNKTTGDNATYRVRIGGTYGAVDGTELVALTAGHAAYQDVPDCLSGDIFERPEGCQLIKLTIQAEENESANIQGTGIVFISA